MKHSLIENMASDDNLYPKMPVSAKQLNQNNSVDFRPQTYNNKITNTDETSFKRNITSECMIPTNDSGTIKMHETNLLPLNLLQIFGVSELKLTCNITFKILD